MLTFTLRRILVMIPQLLLLSIIIFLLAKAMPGDALTGAFQGNPDANAAHIAEIREKMGLNDPWYQQYGRWVANFVQGDMGMSYVHKQPVTALLGNRLSNTILLSLTTMIVIYLISIPLGIIAGRWHNSWADKLIVTYNYVCFGHTSIYICANYAVRLRFLSELVPNWRKRGYTSRKWKLGILCE